MRPTVYADPRPAKDSRWATSYPPRGRVCRNGHDLGVHGKVVESPARPMHLCCTECRRLARRREYGAARKRRAQIRRKTP